MSRIDDALRRLSGNAPAEARTTGTLDRYASEGVLRPTEPSRPAREEHNKIGAFGTAPVRQVDARPAAAAPTPAPTAHTQAEPVPEAEPLIDYRQIRDYGGFVLRSVLRHKLLAASTIVLVLGLTIAALLIVPKSYHVETRLLAQRNAVMTALSNPGRAVPWDADAPTRAAADTVLSRNNLITLITQTDLVREWERRRAPVLKLKDWLIAKLTRHTRTPDEQLDALIGTLEARMKVDAGPVGDGTVTISLDWPDPEMGYRLVQAAQQTFVEARRVAETAAIGESIAILEGYTNSLHTSIDRTLIQLNQAQGKGKGKAAPVPRSQVALARRPPTSAVPAISASLGMPQLSDTVENDPDLKRVKTSLEAKREELTRLVDTRQRQLNDLRTRLSQLKAVYTSNNPTVQGVEQNIAALSNDQPQETMLASQIEELQADYDKRVGDATDAQIRSELTRRSAQAAAAAVGAQPQPVVEPAADPAPTEPAKIDPSSEFATLLLRSELNQFESVLERTDGAKIELAVSQAAFKYRYQVVRPAQVPREPSWPRTRVVLIAGFFASLLLALVVTVSRDLLSNSILESWQIERRLGLPVLGTLRTA